MFEGINVELYVVAGLVVSGILWWALGRLFHE